MGPDGSITLKQKAFNQIITYTFEIYGSTTSGCYSEKLRTIKLSLPKYNYYSSLEMCDGIPDYYLCKEYVDFDIDDATATETIKKYKEKLESGELDEEEIKDNTSIFSKTISNISDNKYIYAGIIVVIGVAITIVIIRRRRNTL